MGLFSSRVKVGPLPPQANPYPSRLRRIRKPSTIVLAFLLITSYYLVVWIHPPFHFAVQDKIISLSYTVSSIVSHPFFVAKTYLTDSDGILSLRDENKRLTEENTKLKHSLLNYAQIQIQNRELKGLADLNQTIPADSKTLPVISLPNDGLHYSCILKGGEKDGIEVNQVAISPDGLVGRIDNVTSHAARVLLLNDYQSKTPIYIPRLSQNAIAVGDGSNTLLLTYLSKSDEVQDGDEVFTSGLGGIYPRGLYVGKVFKTPSGEIRLTPAANVESLAYLHIFSNSDDIADEIRALDEDAQ